MAGRSGRDCDGDMGSPIRRHLECFHDLEDMEGELARGTMRASGPDGMGQVGDADDPVVAARRRRCSVGCSVQSLAAGGDLDGAEEAIGIRNAQARLRPVKLDRPVAMLGHVEAHGDRDDRAGDELQRSRDMGCNLHGDRRALQRLAGDHRARTWHGSRCPRRVPPGRSGSRAR